MTGPETGPLPPVGPRERVPVAELLPGRIVYRWPVTAQSGRLFVALPCHEAQEVYVWPEICPVTAVCRKCSATYDVQLLRYSNAAVGNLAQLTVTQHRFLISRARPGQ